MKGKLFVAERRIGRYLLGRRRGSGGSTCCRVCYRRRRSPSSRISSWIFLHQTKEAPKMR